MRLRSEARQPARSGIGERSGEVRVSPNSSACCVVPESSRIRCPDRPWEATAHKTRVRRRFLRNLGLTQTVILLEKCNSVFKGVSVYLLPKGNIISYVNISTPLCKVYV